MKTVFLHGHLWERSGRGPHTRYRLKPARPAFLSRISITVQGLGWYAVVALDPAGKRVMQLSAVTRDLVMKKALNAAAQHGVEL